MNEINFSKARAREIKNETFCMTDIVSDINASNLANDVNQKTNNGSENFDRFNKLTKIMNVKKYFKSTSIYFS
jgi:hypothetical protein